MHIYLACHLYAIAAFYVLDNGFCQLFKSGAVPPLTCPVFLALAARPRQLLVIRYRKRTTGVPLAVTRLSGSLPMLPITVIVFIVYHSFFLVSAVTRPNTASPCPYDTLRNGTVPWL